MAKSKKVTYKELMERNAFLLDKLIEVKRAVDYTHTLIIAYIDCNGDEEKLKQFLKKENENGKTNRSNTSGDRKDKSGDTSLDSKSTDAGDNSEAGADKN